MARTFAAAGLEEDEPFLVRVAWLYHVEGLTQGTVADRLGVTRLRVNKALADAKRRGILHVSIDSRFAPCAALEARLCKRFELRQARVVLTPGDPSTVQAAVGTGLAHHLEKLLASPEIRLFGIAWGATLYRATSAMRPLHRPDLEILSMMGGLTKGSDINTFEITTRFAHLCGAQHSYFTAPLYAGSRESRDTLMGLDVFQEVLAKIRKVDGVVISAGDLSNRSLLIRDGLPSDVDLSDLVDAGAVGDVLGQFLDARGRIVDHPINERVIGAGVADLATMRNVILAAGGLHKSAILRAVLARGCIDCLITDEACAEAILAGGDIDAEAAP